MKKKEVEQLTKVIKEKYLKKIAEDYLEKACINIELEDAIASGWLLASAYIEDTKNGYKIGFEAPYAKTMEYGIDTIDADITELYEWAYQKFVIRKGEEWTTEELIKKCKQIQNSLLLHGIEPRMFMRHARRDIIDENR